MKITQSRRVNAKASEIWPYLADFGNIHRFHPKLSGSHYLNEYDSCEIGSERQCNLKDGNFLKERVTEFKEGSYYTVEIFDSSYPIKKAIATLGVRALEDGGTEIYMESEMEIPNPLLRPLLYLGFKYDAMPSILKGLEGLHEEEYGLQMA